MKKFLLALALAIAPVFAMSAPDAARKDFCEFAALNAEAAAQAKQKLGMTQEEFETRVVNYAMNLLMQGTPQEAVGEIVEFILQGWDSQLSPEKVKAVVFAKCLKRVEA